MGSINSFPEEAHLPNKEQYSEEELNSIHVFWCSKCLSLNIRRLNLTTNTSYCDNCCDVNIVEGSLKEWEYRVRQANKSLI